MKLSDGLVALDEVLRGQVVCLDLRPERDVLGRDHDRDLAEVRIVGLRRRARLIRLPSVTTMRTNATIARKIPISRTNRFERFKVCISPTDTWVLRVTGGNTLAPRFRPDISQRG